MTIIIFIIILGVLVLVHELGHFLAAKKAGVEVSEFGFGYPPRAITLGKKWGTTFSINWIPFGGFVKILGENYEADESEEQTVVKPKKFTDISKKWQVVILAGGVFFNIIFAWILFSLSFIFGMPTPIENTLNLPVQDETLTITSVLEGSPASRVGLISGDVIKGVSGKNSDLDNSRLSPELVSNFINNNDGPVYLDINRGNKNFSLEVSTEYNREADRKILGIGMDMIGVLKLPVHKAFILGAKITSQITYLTVVGIKDLVTSAAQNKADLSQVTGPIGIVGLVGDASKLGFVYLVSFTALISINLAVINLLPFPALDGGRIIFVIIEAIKKSPINPKVAGVVNMVGFGVLILLMIIVSIRDISNLF